MLDPSAVDAGIVGDSLRPEGERLLLQRHWEEPVEIDIVNGDGGHGGGDAILLSDIFIGPGEDPLARPANWRDGVQSIAVGIAGNRSLATGLPVEVADLGIRLLAQSRPMSRIVVTGGSGRLGRTLVSGLAERGHEIVSLDRATV